MAHIDLLAELGAADCWCGRMLAECEEDGGCRWAQELDQLRVRMTTAEEKLAAVRQWASDLGELPLWRVLEILDGPEVVAPHA
jgi:hypothetical protein